jgi:hypothetical protein
VGPVVNSCEHENVAWRSISCTLNCNEVPYLTEIILNNNNNYGPLIVENILFLLKTLLLATRLRPTHRLYTFQLPKCNKHSTLCNTFRIRIFIALNTVKTGSSR